MEKDFVWNPATCCYGNRKYLCSIIDNSIICNEVIVATKDILTKIALT